MNVPCNSVCAAVTVVCKGNVITVNLQHSVFCKYLFIIIIVIVTTSILLQMSLLFASAAPTSASLGTIISIISGSSAFCGYYSFTAVVLPAHQHSGQRMLSHQHEQVSLPCYLFAFFKTPLCVSEIS